MSNFITNDKTDNLKKRLVELISKSEELKFLVGFFYFSGITELYSSLKEKDDNLKLRILVGLEVDHLLSGMTVECAKSKEKKELSKRDIENNFINSVRKSLNSDDFDRQEFYEQIDFFIDLIIEDKLIIRKTKKPNHAKLYIFELEDKIVQKNLFITGSSNLTKAGLSHQNEFNVEIKDYGTEEASAYFEDLWKDSVPITENKALKDRLIKTIEDETQIKKVTPFEAFAVVLKTYLDMKSVEENDLPLKEIIEKAGYKYYKYQEDAVKQAVKILNLDNGVIVADVVGLGKSIIASLIAKVNKKIGIVLCPPGLISEWENYMSDFGLSSWKVLSSGNIDFAEKFVKKEKADPIEIVIIDEAHRFRNSDTTNYEKLKNLCRNKKVILLSATPFNNSPIDILALLELFTIPKKSSLTLDGNLKNLFKIFKGEFEKLLEIRKFYKHSDYKKVAKAKKNYKSLFGEDKIDIEKVKTRTRELAVKIRSVIEPIVVRRNRLDLQKNSKYKDEVKNLSVIESPKTWFYELTKEQSEFYDTILRDYFGEEGRFTGAIYNPFIYESGKEEGEDLNLEENRQFYSQKNTTIFMKRLLVKRLESSFGSFEKSIENQISITKIILRFIEKNKKYILDRKLIEKITEADEDDVEKALADFAIKLEKGNPPKNNKIYYLENNFKEKEKFIADINSDLEMYQEIKQNLISLNMIENDPKAKAIIEKIKEHLAKKPLGKEPKRKIIIFTEYRDTADFLAKIIEKEFKDRILYSGDLGKEKIKEIKRNFDASYSEEDQENKYDILLATDKISEGFNLNRAGMVINYDIPWNPVRVIQRIGRINRISKKVFEKLQIVNFFPTEKGAELVQTEEIAAGKMFMIHSVLGEDAKIFHPDEEPTPSALFDRFQQDVDDEEEGFETKIINKFREIKEKYPELVKEIGDYPSKIKVAKKFEEKGLLIFTKRQRLHIQEVIEKDEEEVIREVPFESIYEKIYCDNPDLEGLELSVKFWDFYEKAKDFKERAFSAGSQQSIEVKTTNFLKSIVSGENNNSELKEMAEIFLEDIIDYGTLALPTMRRIVSVKEIKGVDDKTKEFKNIIEDLGGINYLDKIKKTIKDEKKEIIIAIENQ
ncbi:MAG: DEAD/DEAH box helicase family protein [Candidatus Pacebacteria bacterium]|nr:DEAD/DEAH box helicase family protein [Candidatus Paceibacterota bacterium]